MSLNAEGWRRYTLWNAEKASSFKSKFYTFLCILLAFVCYWIPLPRTSLITSKQMGVFYLSDD